MEVRIINKFHDKADYNKVYLVGETITFDDARAEYLIKLGLVEPVEAEKELVEETGEASEEVIETTEEPVEISEEPVESAEAEPIEEAVVKPVAKKKSANKDN